MTFDPANTVVWQHDGDSVFLLEEIPGRYVGSGVGRRPDTQNKYAIRVQGNLKSTTPESRAEIARRLCDFLNQTAQVPT